MTNQNDSLYANCPYLHHDPKHGRNFLFKHQNDGFQVLVRLVSLTGSSEDREGEQAPNGSEQLISATFEVVGKDWAAGWLNLPYLDRILDILGRTTQSPFSLGNAPLGRFTYKPSDSRWDMKLLESSLGDSLVTPDNALRRWQQGAKPNWFQARVTLGKMATPYFCRVMYFASIFDPGIPAAIDAMEALSKTSSTNANERLKMPDSLKQSAEEYGKRLSQRQLLAEHLTMYDVGQGSAQALVRLCQSHATPELYIDMGCGRNHVQDATLQQLKFCTSESPPVILSHADEDHWCGAMTPAMAAAGYPAHKLAWTAPATTGSVAFMAFARSVWSQGGSILTLDLATQPPQTITVKTQTGHLLIAQGTSKQFNHSGLIVAAVRKDNNHYWLLPGDCDYHFFPQALQDMAAKSACVALAAFHHGASPKKNTVAPNAVTDDYRRLVYSFGCGNQHRHPTLSAVTMHEAAGWTHDATWLTQPGSTLPCSLSLTRATAWTPKAAPPYMHAGSILVGWSAAPQIPPLVTCCASGCAAAIPTQV